MLLPVISFPVSCGNFLSHLRLRFSSNYECDVFCHCLTTSAMWIQNQVADLEMAKINKEKITFVDARNNSNNSSYGICIAIQAA